MKPPMRRRRPAQSSAGWALILAVSTVLASGATAVEPAGPPPPPPLPQWSPAEIEAARAECTKRLAGPPIQFELLGPIREGECGAPASIRLKGFGQAPGPATVFEPAPVISCRLAAALYRWAAEVVQPEAEKHLQTGIAGMITVSSYNCRSRYSDAGQRLSEHALANALDISEFVTGKGERIALLDHWNAASERSAFLRAIHAGACGIFGTTLGPEANAAHNNHFHLDMKERRQPLCDFTPEQLKAREEAKKKPPAPPPAPAVPAPAPR